MNDLHIPAYPALLDGWRGPVLYQGEAAVLAGVDGDLACVVWPGVSAHHGMHMAIASIPLELTLDLARDEVADRVCRVLLGGNQAPVLKGLRKGRVFGYWPSPLNRVAWSPDQECVDDYDTGHVPALADLDPADDTRLPGGARVVDRLALALVARHVLGGGE